MASGMDKSLMALMGIEDDEPKDQGLLQTHNLQTDQDSEQEDASQEVSEGQRRLIDNLSSTSPSDHGTISGTNRSSEYMTLQARPGHLGKDRVSFLSDNEADTEMEDYRSKKNWPARSERSTIHGAVPRASTSALFASNSSQVQEVEETSLFPANFDPPEESQHSFFEADSYSKLSQKKTTVPKPAPLPSSRSIFSSEFNPFSHSSPDKIRVKKKPITESTKEGSSLFSPTLSPRKAQQSKPVFIPKSISPMKTRIDSPTSNASPQSSDITNFRYDLSSPVTSFALNMKNSSMFSDSDSDISSLEGSIHANDSCTTDIILKASIPADADIEMLVPKRTSNTHAKYSLTSKDLGDLEGPLEGPINGWNLDKEMSQKHQPKDRIKPPSKKELLQTRKDMDRLMRSASLPVQPRMGKAMDLRSLLQKSQAMLDERNAAYETPFLKSDISPDTDPAHSISSKPCPGIRTISLNDSSEDEFETEASSEFSQARLAATKAFLLSPRRKRLSDEASAQILPLSSTVGKLSISNYSNGLQPPAASADRGPLTLSSPPKATKSAIYTDVAKHNIEMRRRQAKTNMKLRKKLLEEAQKSGIWMTPEERAAELMALEEGQQDADDEGSADNTSKANRATSPTGEDIDDKEMELGSADEDYVLSGVSEDEDKGRSVDETKRTKRTKRIVGRKMTTRIGSRIVVMMRWWLMLNAQ
ncbi:hypothetical protein BCR41DRAFT_175841 [Lobosporangium transversale]|uniref:DNA replication checkpoint mediator MRC1 domain-containing protein n=1 Tax=Lobosporangium transversale TaxID=64571 RepID=A0A1Y2GD31_9FUNG|nr:hypothetical protein BCR41DRAFT_175841 [Lobosporangium transversale]ORZ05705.1 hypothetical protein BCR41DRAFT_175841 [Lobosporangium transversale]|eukprot:XP_021877192.1 hypothetical protein BCR41DRAFT_175841 [Lobosporangium transversale]